MKVPKVAVIGAGPAGITAAYQLVKGGAEVDVYEASPAVGGLAKTIRLFGQRVDLGPHRFFSTDRRVNQVWLEVLGNDFRMVDRLTRILYNNRFFYYPLKPLDALSKLGIRETARCISSYGMEKIRPTAGDGSFEDWVIRAFGKRLFEIFFKTYSEKLWGISCRDLDADFAAQRIKKLSLFEAAKAALFGKGGQRHKTLVDNFAYPIAGSGMVYERMARFVESNGQRVFLETPVEQVEINGGKVTGVTLTDGESRSYSHVVSTMPLSLMVSRLRDAPPEIRACCAKLRFRNTILVYLNVDRTDLFPDNWLYVHSPELRTGRITNFRNWAPELCEGSKTTVLCLEYWAYEEDDIWRMSSERLTNLASEEIRRTGLIGEAQIFGGYVHRLSRCYPVYSRGYKEYLRPIESYLSGIDGLSVIGRYGAFKYNNQDHSILMGILSARNILFGETNDLWSVNTDYESYQERATIYETGLEQAELAAAGSLMRLNEALAKQDQATEEEPATRPSVNG
jgi:protoporphyrinogen oxidase